MDNQARSTPDSYAHLVGAIVLRVGFPRSGIYALPVVLLARAQRRCLNAHQINGPTCIKAIHMVTPSSPEPARYKRSLVESDGPSPWFSTVA